MHILINIFAHVNHGLFRLKFEVWANRLSYIGYIPVGNIHNYINYSNYNYFTSPVKLIKVKVKILVKCRSI